MSYADRIIIAEVTNRIAGHDVRPLWDSILDRFEQRPSASPSLRFLLGPHEEPAHRIADALLDRPSEFLPKRVGQQPVRSLEIPFRGVG